MGNLKFKKVITYCTAVTVDVVVVFLVVIFVIVFVVVVVYGVCGKVQVYKGYISTG